MINQPIGGVATQPLIEICIPAYRAERYIQATLDSISAQTWPHWELLVVEDGSHDATESIVRKFAESVSQKVTYHRQIENAGLPKTRNVIKSLASGNWLAFLDADDLWLPNHLEVCADFICRQHSSQASGGDTMDMLLFIFSGCVIFDSDSGAALAHRTPTAAQWADFPYTLHRGEVIIQPSSVVISREALKKAGDFDATFPICNDLEYWFRAHRSGIKILFTGQETVRYRKHAWAMSNSSPDLIAEMGRVHFVHRKWRQIPLRQRRSEIRRHYLNAARMNRRTRPWLALQQIVASLVLPIVGSF